MISSQAQPTMGQYFHDHETKEMFSFTVDLAQMFATGTEI